LIECDILAKLNGFAQCFMSWIQCCRSGIRCLLDPWIQDPEWVFSGSRIRISDPTITSESLRTIILGVKILQFCADFLKYFSVHMGVGTGTGAGISGSDSGSGSILTFYQVK